MRNWDARMIGEVHKRVHRQRHNWLVLPGLCSGIAAVAVCLGIYSITAPTLRAAPQQNASDNNSDPPSAQPVITANPDRVRVDGETGSTEIG